MAYNILVVEDEPLVAKRILRLTRSILGVQVATSQHAVSIASAEVLLEKQDMDLILLDLNLAGEDGFELLTRFTAKASHTIVISAQTDRAIEAFEYGVLDFVAKPFTEERLGKALARLVGDREPAPQQVIQLSFETRNGVEVVPLTDIAFFQAADKYSEAVLRNGDRKFHSKSLNRLQDILSASFVRSHKSYLVRCRAISSLKSLEGSRYEISLIGGDQLPVGRTRIDHVRRVLS